MAYPYFDNNRFVREPYERRTLRELDHAHDPYALRNGDRVSGMDGRPRRLSSLPPPLVTLTASPRERERERRHSSLPLEERRGPYDSFVRLSETPPPRARGHSNRVGGFGDNFGDIDTSSRHPNERLQYDPCGPPLDPFTRRSSVADRPYGGGPAPRDPFRPGGGMYDYERTRGHHHRSIEPDRSFVEDDQERRRYNHYRGAVGEPWGLANYRNYEGRRRNERRMSRENSRTRDDHGGHDDRAARDDRGGRLFDWESL